MSGSTRRKMKELGLPRYELARRAVDIDDQYAL
jgi:hypothetical protein